MSKKENKAKVINELIGKTFSWVYKNHEGNLVFTEKGTNIKYVFTHDQECCEIVNIEDINGDLRDLVKSPLLTAEEVVQIGDDPKPNDDSCTWTFYKFSTTKGYVTVRWYGSSNGYYSERVTVYKIYPREKIWGDEQREK